MGGLPDLGRATVGIGSHAATNAENAYDYAGQDAVNTYDLAGTDDEGGEADDGEEVTIPKPGEPEPETIEPPYYYASIGYRDWQHAYDDTEFSKKFIERLKTLGYSKDQYLRLGGYGTEGGNLGRNWLEYEGRGGKVRFNPQNRALLIIRPNGKWNIFRLDDHRSITQWIEENLYR